MGTSVAVIIPTHKIDLNSNETVSLKRCNEVFRDYPIILAVPEGLDIRVFQRQVKVDKAAFFKTKFFDNERGFNKLMSLPCFYEKFTDYEYILIYHLDAFVFENNLDEWCSLGFDYIGAPWIESTWIKGFFLKYRLLRKFEKRMTLVGNGGFSLRRVSQLLRGARIFRPFAGLFKHEDFFWSNLVNRCMPSFKIPDPETASKFAFEEKPSALYKMNNCSLPFGCHSWEKFEPFFWKHHFQRYGYHIDQAHTFP